MQTAVGCTLKRFWVEELTTSSSKTTKIFRKGSFPTSRLLRRLERVFQPAMWWEATAEKDKETANISR